MSITKLILLSTCGLILSGCANAKSIHRKSSILPQGQTEFIDAKQRAILVNPVYDPVAEDHKEDINARIKNRRYGSGGGGNKTTIIDHGSSDLSEYNSRPMYRMCSEPAPDVFSAYAFSAAAEVAANVTSPEKGGSGMFGLSSAETAATIERTQVINMLRESMFRTCERWMNGALDQRQMNIQTARDQRMMVATLAIEQLTGVIKRKPTVLSTSAVSAMEGQAELLGKRLVSAENQTKEAKETREKREDELKVANKAYAEKNVVPTKFPEGYNTMSCDVLEPLPVDSKTFEAKLAQTNASKPKCVELKKAPKQTIIVAREADLKAENKKLIDANAKYDELNTNGSCDIWVDTDSTEAQRASITPPPTEKQCKDQKKVIDAAPGLIETAQTNLEDAKKAKPIPGEAYNNYNAVAKQLPMNMRKSCAILTDDPGSALEKSTVDSSLSKETCQTLDAIANTAKDNLDTAQKNVEEREKAERTISKQLERQTSMFLSAQGGGSGDAGNDPSSAARIAAVVDTVQAIVFAATSDQSEIIYSCMQDLRNPDMNSVYRDACIGMIKTQFEANNMKSLYGTNYDKIETEIKESRAFIANTKDFNSANFSSFWNKVRITGSNTQVDSVKLASVMTEVNKKTGNFLMFSKGLEYATTKSELESIFNRLGRNYKTALAN